MENLFEAIEVEAEFAEQYEKDYEKYHDDSSLRAIHAWNMVKECARARLVRWLRLDENI